jgi:hypothetical protein
MLSLFLAIYLLACAVCGVMGRNTTFGFVGHFLVAFFLTPVLDFIILAVARPNARQREKLLEMNRR